MYIYDDFDRILVVERVREFRDQVARRLSGELTEDEFKPLRLMNGWTGRRQFTVTSPHHEISRRRAGTDHMKRSTFGLLAVLVPPLTLPRPTPTADLTNWSDAHVAQRVFDALTLESLLQRVSQAPRRRNFTAVPINPDNCDLRDTDALNMIVACQVAREQVWDNTVRRGLELVPEVDGLADYD